MTVNIMNEFGYGSIDAASYPSIIKWNAKTAKWSVRTQQEDNPEVHDATATMVWKEFEFPKQVAVDMPNFKKGWSLLEAGKAPNTVWSHYQDKMPEKPSDNHKSSFEVNILFKNEIGFTVFSSQAMTVLIGMQEFLTEYQEKKPDDIKVPVCTVVYEDIGTKHGPVTVPKFKIVKFIERPEKMVAMPINETPQPKQEEKQISKPKAEVDEEFDDDLDKAFADEDDDDLF